MTLTAREWGSAKRGQRGNNLSWSRDIIEIPLGSMVDPNTVRVKTRDFRLRDPGARHVGGAIA